MRLPNFIKFRPKESLIFLHYHILQALQWSAILGPPSGVRQFIKTSENCVKQFNKHFVLCIKCSLGFAKQVCIYSTYRIEYAIFILD